ncbi:cytochrome c oxidase subunit 2A [Cohnella sp. WQ 127256]|uniref:cytochrome c oxidase subunit 2A n=1 Tax=Cohnella sp. WQ 127256 TaxID=2938790 RepID=UPI0021199748|nr:cytochrome c oxidase subunit 2A [Cohnella sp. WQ 127256]
MRDDRTAENSHDSSSVSAPKEESLKGTFVSVLLLGAFLLLTWLGIFILFISRD